MPTSGWTIAGHVRVADVRRSRYLLINQRTGLWSVTNRAGVSALGRNDDCASDASVPAILRDVRDELAPSRHPTWGTHAPADDDGLLVIYKLTDRCNYRCSYCYDRKAARPLAPTRRDASIRQVLDGALAAGKRVCVLFHGGEPLLEFAAVRELVEAYRRFWPGQLRFSLQTNLSCLDQPMLDFLHDYRFDVSVSVDGTTPEANRLRVLGGRADPYDVVLQKTRALRGLRRDRLNLLVTVGRHNARLLPDALIQMQADGFAGVSLSFMQEVNRTAEGAAADTLSDALLQVARSVADGRIGPLALWTLIHWVQQVTCGRSESMCFSSPCGAGRNLITVFPSGEIGPCDSIFDDRFVFPDLPQYLAGRNSAGGGAMAELLRRDVATLAPCAGCDVRAHCNGTCPGNVILEHGRLQGVAAQECAFHYAWIRELMWLLSDEPTGRPLLDYCYRHVERRRRERVNDFAD